MPTKASPGASGKPDIPSTILRSDKHAQSLWSKARDSAEKTYGEGGRAYRVAYAALKHEYEKRGDKWVRKPHPGPSDPQAARGPTTEPASTDASPAPTAGGKVARSEAEARVKQKEARKEYAQSRRKQTPSRA
jgi:cation transport regulator ChaB